MKQGTRRVRQAVIIAAVPVLATFALAQEAPIVPISTPDDARAHGLESLRKVVEQEGVPLPSNLSRFVVDMDAAVALGKALFHEQSVGSDAVEACVTCHFKAGADTRSLNQVSPGLLRVENERNGDVEGFWKADADPDKTFQIVNGPNEELTTSDFPFAEDINGTPRSNYDVASSQGITFTEFVSVNRPPGGEIDVGNEYVIDPDGFNLDGLRSTDASLNVRRVEPRNSPTMINAVFNFTNFWDGRANNSFNGENPFGDQDVNARVYQSRGRGLVAVKMNMKNASLASQAVGPPLSHFEMSFGNGVDNGRSFPDVGRKLLDRPILELQDIHPQDSVLGAYADVPRTTTYRDLIQKAFKEQYWRSDICIQTNPRIYPAAGNQAARSNGRVKFIETDGNCEDEGIDNLYSLTEANFSMFYGLAVMVYEATLVADWSPFDQWMLTDGSLDAVKGFGRKELDGLNVFVNQGKCVNCHGGPETTNASVRNAQSGNNVIEPMIMGDNKPGIYDNGFYNIGVTPTHEDLSRGGNDPFGRPLSFTRQFAFQSLGIRKMPFPITGNPIQNLQCDPNGGNLDTSSCGVLGFVDQATGNFHAVCNDLDGDGACGTEDELILQRVAVDGAFKTPGLRNIAETAPYFHNGSAQNLAEVVQFYDRGGIFCDNNKPDLDPDIRRLGLDTRVSGESYTLEEALVAFMIALTDERVVKRSAPFDHPSYLLPIDGRERYPHTLDARYSRDISDKVAAVGRNGSNNILPRFLEDSYGELDHFATNPKLDGVCSSGSSSGGSTSSSTSTQTQTAEQTTTTEETTTTSRRSRRRR